MLRRLPHLAFCAVLAMSAGAIAAVQFAGGQPPAFSMASGAPLQFTSYAVGFAPSWEEPAWCAEHLTAAQAKAGEAAPRTGNFHPEAQLPKAERVTPADYDKTGYDRGHMCPAGDFGPDKPESFSMANMVPQKPNLNRKVWAGLEAAVRQLAERDGDLYVVTGPCHDIGEPAPIGRVAVPFMTWKAVFDVKVNGAGVYRCTNADAPVCTIESVAKLVTECHGDPFPSLSPAVKSVAMTLPAPLKGALAD